MALVGFSSEVVVPAVTPMSQNVVIPSGILELMVSRLTVLKVPEGLR